MADASRFQEFQHGQAGLMPDASRFDKFHHVAAVREDGPCKALENAWRVRGCLPEKETNPQGS
jgi:hypothetical protein